MHHRYKSPGSSKPQKFAMSGSVSPSGVLTYHDLQIRATYGAPIPKFQFAAQLVAMRDLATSNMIGVQKFVMSHVGTLESYVSAQA